MGPVVILLVAQSPAAAKGGAPLLLSMMSVFALVSAFTGGMYLALDATAGERERGSLVPLLLNPVSRRCISSPASGSRVAMLRGRGLALNLAGFHWRSSNGAVSRRRRYDCGSLLLWIVAGLVPVWHCSALRSIC